jgi:hypothetical protein
LTFPRKPDCSELGVGRAFLMALPSSREFALGQVAERTAGSVVVLVVPPDLQLIAQVLHRDELVGAKELVAQPPVEGLDEPVCYNGLGKSSLIAALRYRRLVST